MAMTKEKYINCKTQTIPKSHDELKALKRLSVALSKAAQQKNCTDPNAFIVCGIDELPSELPVFESSSSPRWQPLTDDDVDRLRTFYNQRVPVQCRIRDCNAVPAGFREVVKHQHVHHRKYTHMCVAPNCYVPFDKLGNAKRHVAT